MPAENDVAARLSLSQDHSLTRFFEAFGVKLPAGASVLWHSSFIVVRALVQPAIAASAVAPSVNRSLMQAANFLATHFAILTSALVCFFFAIRSFREKDFVRHVLRTRCLKRQILSDGDMWQIQ